ncbi:hypothetical protein F5141DRAFT_1067892 [Pisolithus sp. B1]|nr:hypothetical protein F5141DRAFT_1067892 [Pisolithus sp. B1]
MPATTSNRKILGLFHNLQHQTTLSLDARAEALAMLSSQKKVEYKQLPKGPTLINPAKGSQKAHIPTGSSHTQSQLDSSIFHVVQPNGSTLLENKGHGKAGVAESTLWFASQKAVPDDIYESWNTEPVVVGSDSDADSYSFSAIDTDVISILGTGSNSDIHCKHFPIFVQKIY